MINLTKKVQTHKLQNIAERNKTKINGDIFCSFAGRLNIIKMSILPKLICSFNIIPIKSLHNFLVGIDQPILKFMWNCKECLKPKQLGKRKKANDVETIGYPCEKKKEFHFILHTETDSTNGLNLA